MEAEFDNIDKNGGGQILFSEFVDWAIEKDLDVEDDVEPEDQMEEGKHDLAGTSSVVENGKYIFVHL